MKTHAATWAIALAEKDGMKCIVTKAVTVKDMHDLAAELRRKGAQVFFAQIKD